MILLDIESLTTKTVIADVGKQVRCIEGAMIRPGTCIILCNNRKKKSFYMRYQLRTNTLETILDTAAVEHLHDDEDDYF